MPKAMARWIWSSWAATGPKRWLIDPVGTHWPKTPWEMCVGDSVDAFAETDMPSADRWAPACEYTTFELCEENPPIILRWYPPPNPDGSHARHPCKYGLRFRHPLTEHGVIVYEHLYFRWPAVFFRNAGRRLHPTTASSARGRSRLSMYPRAPWRRRDTFIPITGQIVARTLTDQAAKAEAAPKPKPKPRPKFKTPKKTDPDAVDPDEAPEPDEVDPGEIDEGEEEPEGEGQEDR